jgi:aryl-alcohol dehydrogenase-like predicted oxidoreductase
MDRIALGDTGIQISRLGLGTVKFGRNEQVKYPTSFELPNDGEIRSLLDLASELGVNMLDTAPAYGSSMQRLGSLLNGRRERWVIVSKVGEFFEQGRSRFDFSYAATVQTVEESLRILRTDYLDMVLIHSDGDDVRIFEQEATMDALRDLKRRGLIRAHGMSSKTLAGGLRTVAEADVVMATLNPAYRDELPVIAAAHASNKGVLIKKGLQSGHIAGPEGVTEAMRLIFSQAGVGGLIVGTVNPQHLRDNVATLNAVLASTASA